jgi:prepilin-type N-terminal cleavage/methylation domain-containing protein
MKLNGFTIIELMVSIGILAVLFALTTINITRLPSSASQSSSYDRLVSDLRGQQTKAMVGYNSVTGATGGSAYGVYFDVTANSYTLFAGLNYSGGTEYYTVDLDPNLTFTGITFPNSQVVFAIGSGDTASGSASITNSLTGEVKTLKLNKYGATE